MERLKKAAAKFVCIDIRPFYAIECSGLQDLLLAANEIGKKYPQMSADEFLKLIPSRNTVKATVTDGADYARDAFKILFRESIQQGGLGCTLDLWTDSYKSNTYMAMTANVLLIRATCVEQKRLVFHMGHVTDIVKSKGVIKSRIIEVFDDYEVTAQEIKEYVTFTTDR